MSDQRVAVIGLGTMGRGIARVFASAGHPVSVTDRDQPAIVAGWDLLRQELERSAVRGRLEPAGVEAVLARIHRIPSLSEAVGEASLIIEAVPEDLDLKRDIFRRLDTVVPSDAVLATNTSALSIADIAAATSDPTRVLGLHFFNPVHRMELVEVVVHAATSRATVTRAVTWCHGLGKTTIEVRDRPGFATSRINAMIGNEAFRMLEEGVASAEDIDTAMRLALGHPMGPFELVDLVGLDTRLAVLRRLHEGLGDRFRPAASLVQLVDAGRLGRKVGHGVFRYDADGSRLS